MKEILDIHRLGLAIVDNQNLNLVDHNQLIFYSRKYRFVRRKKKKGEVFFELVSFFLHLVLFYAHEIVLEFLLLQHSHLYH
jgi:hypothetical protein